jgi:hypothetical protein
MKRIFIEFIGILAIYLVLRGISDFSEASEATTFILGWFGGVLAMAYLRFVEPRGQGSQR